MSRNSRSHGTGTLRVRGDAWYAQWRNGDRQVQRRIGRKRLPGTRDGLTRAQAERAMRRMIEAEALAPPQETLTLAQAGERLIAHLAALGRKPSTISDYSSILRVHLAPFFDGPVAKITAANVELYIESKRRAGQAPKTTLNQLGLLHAIFEFAARRGWARANPCTLVDKPTARPGSDIRYLSQPEVEALLRAARDDPMGRTDRALWLTAAMTGLRQGELLALRWVDVDWVAARVRVRRSYVRREFGTPKTRRSSRSVPLADRVAAALERHFQRSRFQADDDLVFPNPDHGTPLDASKVRVRFKDALERAGVRPVRFHDLRHSFATRMAAAGVPMRTLQEWLGHRDFATTLRYADYQPGDREAELVERAFGAGTVPGAESSESVTARELARSSYGPKEL